ncbi:MAG: NADH-quinone oxidoreductase subunit J family protein [Nitrososphaeria archaeon]|jgi:NADH:ubiquinone oxidoreductase subunit 6 (subunit J)
MSPLLEMFASSVITLGSPFLDIALLVLAATSIIFAYLTVTYKSLVYSSIFLAFVGLVNAAFFMILGYPLLAFVQLIIYVGSGVLFIIISISMLKEPKLTFRPNIYSWVITLFIFVLIVVIGISVGIAPSELTYLGIFSAVHYLVEYWFSILLLVLALSMALIVSIAVSRGEEE